jgi:hypothetical protein
MYAIINDATQAYRGVIPADRWVETSEVLVRQPLDGEES